MPQVGQTIPMPQTTPYAQEMAKHEARDTQYGRAGRPHVLRDYPTHMYRVTRDARTADLVWDEQVANDEHEREVLERRGFVHGGKAAAMDALEKQQEEFGTIAAERNYAVVHGKVGEKATAEMRAEEQAHSAQHLPDVVTHPKTAKSRRATKVDVKKK